MPAEAICDASSVVKRPDLPPSSTFLRLTVQLVSGAMSSAGSHSTNNNKDDSHGQGGWQYPASYNELQPPPQDGMTTEPSVGRFTEKEKAASMFGRKPATPSLVQPRGSSSSSDIVYLNGAATGAERKMNVKNSPKGKK